MIKNLLANAGDPGLIPGLGRSPGEWIGHPTSVFLGFPGGSDGKQFTCSVGDLGSTPGLGRSPGGGHGDSLQHPCLENPMDRRACVSHSPHGCREMDMTEVSMHIQEFRDGI